MGVVCGLNLILVLFLGENELVVMFVASLLVFWIPVTVGIIL